MFINPYAGKQIGVRALRTCCSSQQPPLFPYKCSPVELAEGHLAV